MELINFLIEHYYLSVPLLVVIFLFLISNSKKGGKKVSCQTLISLSNQDKALIIDVRDSSSFDTGHITASKNIPSKDLARRSNEINNNDKFIVLVCESGNISKNAGETLKKEGFENVCTLKGGINEWKMCNLPLV
jgi:rhodanese-related sulfurtransferase